MSTVLSIALSSEVGLWSPVRWWSPGASGAWRTPHLLWSPGCVPRGLSSAARTRSAS
jgi:hypothetical protein